jgi:hypothetical protein
MTLNGISESVSYVTVGAALKVHLPVVFVDCWRATLSLLINILLMLLLRSKHAEVTIINKVTK